MAMYVNIPFGTKDFADLNEENAAERVGHRIRKIRKAKKWSQAELGEKVGLNADRIQKYENGARRPKYELTKKIAHALGVDTQALTDPVTTTYMGVMYALFEMEDLFDLHVQDDGRVTITFGNGVTDSPNSDLRAWCKRIRERDEALKNAKDDAEREAILYDYNMWKWTFPDALVINSRPRNRKQELEETISRLQEELDHLEEHN